VVYIDKERLRVLQERRCDSKGRGAVYDPVLGICCHFCRLDSYLCQHISLLLLQIVFVSKKVAQNLGIYYI
jgi:hypothetical protein